VIAKHFLLHPSFLVRIALRYLQHSFSPSIILGRKTEGRLSEVGLIEW
jgi:hypothetical protein